MGRWLQAQGKVKRRNTRVSDWTPRLENREKKKQYRDAAGKRTERLGGSQANGTKTRPGGRTG